MTNFANAARCDSHKTFTENGATAMNTTGDRRLDLFATIGALRGADEDRILRLFSEAYKVDPLFATKIAFYARDIRGGLGERKTFRTIIKYLAENHPEAIRPNLDLIGVYGRYDDLYTLIGTPVESDMWAAMKAQLTEDITNMQKGCATSLLAKWIKTADASSENTRRLGILTARKMGYSVYTFKRIVRDLRRHIGVVECLMSANKWDEIKYPEVPSRAMMIYRNAFLRHDSDRFSEFVNKAKAGEVKINSGTLYPYDIVEKVFSGNYDDTLEAQWRQLPDYVDGDVNALVIADVSGSMWGRPLATSVGLAIYFAERNRGAYHNLFMSFSERSEINEIRGETLAQKIKSVSNAYWGMNTNLKGAFEKVLEIAIENHVPEDEMPKALIVISDMEIDVCSSRSWLFYDAMEEEFEKYGYKIPNIIFWNVDSRNDVFHADSKRKGVQLFSGQSASTFSSVIRSIDMDPIEAMESVINSERYSPIKVG